MFFDPSLKDPFFLSRLVFTTVDSYMLNFFKIPVGEIKVIEAGYSRGHFDVPRYSIISAINVFDEYHLLTPGDSRIDEVKGYVSHAWTALHTVITRLIEYGVPLVLETATPRLQALARLRGEGVRALRIALKLRKSTEGGDGLRAVYDEDFSIRVQEAH